ncbi:MAG: hypothetical protein LUE16_00540 [Lachnospiraceae bacterium]|nr:hypothetical protein [Lachnospiraceae bacterium]
MILFTLLLIYAGTVIAASVTMMFAIALYPSAKRWGETIGFNELERDFFLDNRGAFSNANKIPYSEKLTGVYFNVLRRTIDLLIACFWIFLMSPIILIYSVIIFISHKGGPLFERIKIVEPKDNVGFLYQFICRKDHPTFWDRFTTEKGINRILLCIPLLIGDVSISGLSISSYDDNIENCHMDLYDLDRPGIINLAIVLGYKSNNNRYLCDKYYLSHKNIKFDLYMLLSALAVDYTGQDKLDVEASNFQKNVKEVYARVDINRDDYDIPREATGEDGELKESIEVEGIKDSARQCLRCKKILPHIKSLRFCPYCGQSVLPVGIRVGRGRTLMIPVSSKGHHAIVKAPLRAKPKYYNRVRKNNHNHSSYKPDFNEMPKQHVKEDMQE